MSSWHHEQRRGHSYSIGGWILLIVVLAATEFRIRGQEFGVRPWGIPTKASGLIS